MVATDCVGFGEAPAGVIDALQRLTWAGRKAVQDGTFINFNELLAVGYFEKGSMGVSSLVLGVCGQTLTIAYSTMMTAKRA